MIEFYVDGSCPGNPGPGGYAIVALKDGEVVRKMGGRKRKSSNNEMELMAVLESLKYVDRKQKIFANENINIYSDSQYVVAGINKWMECWRQNNWRTYFNNLVKHKPIWEAMYEYINKYPNVKIVKVKGHSADLYNDLADKLAREQANYWGVV